MSKAAELAKWGEVSTNGQVSGRRNMIINGAMNVAQRATSATGVGASNAYFTVDRMYMLASTAGRLTMTQTADGPSGFANCIKLDCTTADTSIGAGEYFVLGYHMEGQDLQQLKKGTSDAETVTVSFYVKGNASATYTCEFRDVENTRNISQEFSVTTSWNRISLTFDGDTVGALSDDTTGRMYLYFWLHAGSTYAGGTHTSNAWHTTTANRVSDSQTSIVDSTDREFFITGLQMEVGSVATPFEHRSFGEELALCQRYYYRINPTDTYQRYGHTMMINATLSETILTVPVTMRSEPTFENSGTVSNYAIYIEGQVKAISADFAINAASGNDRFMIRATIASSNQGHTGVFLPNGTLLGFIAFSAEL